MNIKNLTEDTKRKYDKPCTMLNTFTQGQEQLHTTATQNKYYHWVKKVGFLFARLTRLPCLNHSIFTLHDPESGAVLLKELTIVDALYKYYKTGAPRWIMTHPSLVLQAR